MPTTTITGASPSRRAAVAAAASVLAIVVAACGASTPTPFVTTAPATASGAPSAVAPASGAPSALATSTPSPTATPVPTATPEPTPAACAATGLAARITNWSAGMGQRFADIELTNTGQATCIIFSTIRPQLVDGHGAVLIDSTGSGTQASISFGPGIVLKTQVAAGNYCGPAVVAPVSVAFFLGGAAGRVVAAPLSPTDQSGLPPCNGNPGDPGQISMHDWAP